MIEESVHFLHHLFSRDEEAIIYLKKEIRRICGTLEIDVQQCKIHEER
jgi:hypothetical protein